MIIIPKNLYKEVFKEYIIIVVVSVVILENRTIEPWLAWFLLYEPGYLWNQKRSTCVCFLSAGRMNDMHHHAWLIFLFYFFSLTYKIVGFIRTLLCI